MIKELNKELTALLSDKNLSWDKCQRISYLYTSIQAIKEYGNKSIPLNDKNAIEGNSRGVDKELNDIIPCLSEYLKTKQDFREGKTTEQAVIHQAERLTVEVNEFITALNAHATDRERDIFSRIK